MRGFYFHKQQESKRVAMKSFVIFGLCVYSPYGPHNIKDQR